MLSRLIQLLICSSVALTLMLASVATAAPAKIPPAARSLYKRARTEYTLGNFKEARKHLEAAARIVEHPTIVLALAQCHRQLGHLEKALFAYNLYRGLSPKKRFEDLDQIIAKLKDQLARAEAARPPPSPRATTAPATQPKTSETPPPEVRRSSTLLGVAIATAIVAVTAEATAIAFTFKTRDEFEDTNAYERYKTTAIVSHVAAASSALVSGILWYFWATSGRPEATQAASSLGIIADGGGLGAVFTHRF